MSLSSYGILSAFVFLLENRSGINYLFGVVNLIVLAIGLLGFAVTCCHMHRNRIGALLRTSQPHIEKAQKREETDDERSLVSRLPKYSSSYDDVLAVTRSIHRLYRGGYGGVIVFDASTGRALTIEFYGPGLNNGINIQYSASPTTEEAKNFTRYQHSDYFQIPLKHDMFGKFLEFLYQHSTPVTNFASGRRLYRSIIP